MREGWLADRIGTAVYVGRRPALAALFTFVGVGSMAACKSEITGPKPQISGATPAAVCNAQLSTDVRIAGDEMSPLPVDTLQDKAALALPDVTLTHSQDLQGQDGSGVQTLLSGAPGADGSDRLLWESQQALVMQIDAALALDEGLYGIAVTNANGQSVELPDSLLAVPPPSLQAMAPDLICGDQDNVLLIDGQMMIRLSEQLPRAHFGDAASGPGSSLDSCTTLPGATGAQACEEMTVQIPSGTLSAGTSAYVNLPLAVQNPESVQCVSTEDPILTVVNRPVLDAIEPVLACIEQRAVELSVSGSGFLTVDDATPTLSVGDLDLPALVVASSCTDVDGPAATVRSCTALTAVVPQTSLSAGVYDVTVTNPTPADCVSTEPVQIRIVPPPQVSDLLPDMACVADGDRSVRIEGVGFLVLHASSDPQYPVVTVGGTDFVPTYDADTDCAAFGTPPDDALVCSALTVTVPQTLTVGPYTVTVTNPDPAGCTSDPAQDLFVMSPPTLLAIEPAAICLDQGDIEVTVSGSDFLAIDTALPTLYLDAGTAMGYQPADAGALGGCVAYDAPAENVQVCSSFAVTLPQDPTATGVTSYAAWVENPAPAGCASGQMTLTRYPEATVDPSPAIDLCTSGGVVTVTGDGLSPHAQIYVDTVVADSVVVNVDGTSATAYFPVLPPGEHDVIFANAAGCIQPLVTNVPVGLGAMAFFADPPVVFNGIDTRITIFATGLTDLVTVTLLATDGSGGVVDLSDVDTSDPGKVRATVPKHDPSGGQDTLAGLYNLQLSGAGGGCERALLTNSVTVTDATDVDITSVSPGFAYAGASTPITIKAAAGEVGFLAVPRLYLNPASGTGTAVAVEAVTFLDEITLTAQVPAGLTPDTYDVVAVNHDGTVGLSSVAEGRLLVVAAPPPRIDSISPGFVINNTPVTLHVDGANFDSSPLPEVVLLCEDSLANQWTTEVTETTGTSTSVEGTFTIVQQTEAFCVVRVTNADSSFDQFSSLVVVGNDQKLFPFSAGPDMKVPRRALAAAAARATNAARYLYAIGGDDGTDSGVHDTVEAAAVDTSGRPYDFVVLQGRMSTARALHGAVTIDRFVYVIGGTADASDPAQTLATVERAYVLSPDERPALTSLDIDVSEDDSVTGVGAGTWFYRVSAVMALDDPFNPGGESLPSEAFVVRIPDLGTYKVKVTLGWTAVTGAVAYRVYRSPNGDDAGGETRLAWQTVDDTTEDTDTGVATSETQPLQVGALGVWHAIDDGGAPLQLNTPRSGAAVVAAQSPDASRVNIYVLVGSDGSVLKSSYEWCGITLEADGRQTVAAGFTEVETGSPGGLSPRWKTSAWVATPENAPNVGATHYLYLGGGAAQSGNPVDDLDVAVIDWASDGALTAGFTTPGGASTMQQQAGYGAVSANNYLYAFGGKQNIDASTTCHQAHICNDDGLGCNNRYAPDVDNWTNTESGMIVPRRLMGVAVESAFIYVLGGESEDGPTVTTEMTVW